MRIKDISHNTLLISLISFDAILILFSVTFPDDPKTYFKEFQLITWISALKLLSTSYIAWKLYKVRNKELDVKGINSQSKIWFLIAAGFLFLFFDEVALIHENIDKAIHIILNMQETGLSDRLDDLIVILYAAVGILILYKYKNEILKFKDAIQYIVIGFIVMIFRTAIDIVTNRADIVPRIINNEDQLIVISNYLAVAEGSGKIIAESFFIVAFYYCLKKVLEKENS